MCVSGGGLNMAEDTHRIRPKVYMVIPDVKLCYPDPFPLRDIPAIIHPSHIWPLELRFASMRGPERIQTLDGRRLTADYFRNIRETLRFWIETTDKPRICAVLGVSKEEPWIVQVSPEDLRF
jgi:hypothetical protein